MLNYALVNGKPQITKDNVNYIDLLADLYNLDNASFSGYPIVVEHYYIARPDLISLAVYGSDEYADIICKINGISNPFELNEGAVIIVPSISFIRSCLNNVITPSEQVSNAGVDKIHTMDKGIKKERTESRSPNEQTVNENNYIIDNSNGFIFY